MKPRPSLPASLRADDAANHGTDGPERETSAEHVRTGAEIEESILLVCDRAPRRTRDRTTEQPEAYPTPHVPLPSMTLFEA